MDNRHIRFSLDRSEVDFEQLMILFQRNAFWAQDRQIDEMKRAVEFSNPVVSVWDGSRMIGFGRITSDGVYRAVIWDVVVDLDYRRQGLGRKLVETLISHPHVQGVERVYLFTTHQQAFYERIGFVENTSKTLVLMGKALEFVTPSGESLLTPLHPAQGSP
ncbi:MAG: GNAT family N-acetyltransferase [Cyanobacteriota bacterium]|nr:GNAT family N-acetyltransferase [Cyanobacteriota bacterium]